MKFLHWATIFFFFDTFLLFSFDLHSALFLQLYLPNFHRTLYFNHHIFLISTDSFLVSHYSFHTAGYVDVLTLYVFSQLSLKILNVDFFSFNFFVFNTNTIYSRISICLFSLYFFILKEFLMCLIIPEYILMFKNKAIKKKKNENPTILMRSRTKYSRWHTVRTKQPPTLFE